MTKILQGITGLEIGGGIACVARCVSRSLEELAEAGALGRVDRVLLQDDPVAPPQPPRFGEQTLSRNSQARFVAQLWTALRRHRHDLVFFDQLGLARSIQLPLPGFGNTRYAIFCHGIELARATGGARRRALTRAWRLVCNSERTAIRVRACVPEAASRVRVAPLCIDPALTSFWEGAQHQAQREGREVAVLIVGRMWSEERGKGHDALLEAWSNVRQRVPEAQLWVVGEGDDRRRLERKAMAVAPKDSVKFFGRVGDAELSNMYRRAAVFAMPSRQEGFGLVYAEAMWHGLPCVASNADSGAEVVRDGETGVLVPYGDVAAIASTLTALLCDPERCRRMGEAGAHAARTRFAYPRFREDVLRALELPTYGAR